MASDRIRGYLGAAAVGVAFGLLVNATDLEEIRKNREKAIEVVAIVTLILGAVTNAYQSNPLGLPPNSLRPPTETDSQD